MLLYPQRCDVSTRYVAVKLSVNVADYGKLSKNIIGMPTHILSPINMGVWVPVVLTKRMISQYRNTHNVEAVVCHSQHCDIHLKQDSQVISHKLDNRTHYYCPECYEKLLIA